MRVAPLARRGGGRQSRIVCGKVADKALVDKACGSGEIGHFIPGEDGERASHADRTSDRQFNAVKDRQDHSINSIRKRCTVDFTDADLEELERQELITRDNEQILLADKGKSIAKIIIRRHRLAEILVSSILKLKQSDMEDIACRVEHSLLPEVEESICTLLGHP